MILTETQVNSSSIETHGEYLFFLSSDVPHDKSDREHAGVGLMIHKRLKPCIYEVCQISGRLILLRLRSYGSNLALVGTYVPHLKEDSYDRLQTVVAGLNEVVLIGGDFNARLHYRYANESDVLGPNIFGRGRDYLEQVVEQTTFRGDPFFLTPRVFF